jgi:hypothetical protein
VNILLKLFVPVLVLIFSGCQGDVFEFDISKSVLADTKRIIEMKSDVKMEIPEKENKTVVHQMTSRMKYEASLITQYEIKDPEKTGEFTYSEQIKEAFFSIAQNRNQKGKNSIDVIFKGGELAVNNKKETVKPEAEQPDIETVGKDTMTKMLKTSDDTAVITVDKLGNTLEVEADIAVRTRISQAMQMSSGAFGIVFEKDKKIKPGDSWIEKKILSWVGGLQVLGNPIEIEIHFKREKNAEFEGRKVAVFSSSYSFEQKEVNGVFGGFPVHVDVSGENSSTGFFDLKKGFFVKTEMSIKNRIKSTDNKTPEELSNPFKMDIDIENSSHSTSVMQ